MDGGLLLYSLLLFVVPFLAGSLTLLRRWSPELLHLFLSFGAGIFLGAVFGHLLPETMENGNLTVRAMAVLVGYLLIFFVERILSIGHPVGQTSTAGHKVVSITVLIGLSVHSLIEGFGMAVAQVDLHLRTILFVSILTHKAPAAFALGSLMMLAEFSRRRMIISLLVLSAMTPLGAVLLSAVFTDISDSLLGVLTGLVCGTFMYVAMADMLPEAFHSPRRRWLHLLLLVAGIVVMALVGFWATGYDGPH